MSQVIGYHACLCLAMCSFLTKRFALTAEASGGPSLAAAAMLKRVMRASGIRPNVMRAVAWLPVTDRVMANNTHIERTAGEPRHAVITVMPMASLRSD